VNVIDLDLLAQQPSEKNYQIFFRSLVNLSSLTLVEIEVLNEALRKIDVFLYSSNHSDIIKNLDFWWEQQQFKDKAFKMLQTDVSDIAIVDVVKSRPDFIVRKNDKIQMEEIFNFITSEKEKIKSINSRKNDIIKKSEELESFNKLLSQESEKKIELIKKFLSIEENRKKNEKKLLYFLDLINLEIAKPTFIQSVLNFLWKESGCVEFAMMIGFQHEGDGQEFTVFYDGTVEKIIYEKKINFKIIEDKDLDRQFANLLKRPTSPVQSIRLDHNKKSFHFFYEVKNSDPDVIQRKNAFFQDRISILSMAVSNWIMDHKLKIQFEIWDYIFKNWSDPVHLIDDQYRLIKSNYDVGIEAIKSKHCFQILAGLDQPCPGCPVKAASNQGSVSFGGKRFQSISSIYQNEGTSLHLVFYQDKTNSDLLKKEFIQSEKLKLLGQLSNHLSHELNNPLTGLKLQAEFFLKQNQVSQSPTLSEDFLQIADGLQRSIDIIQDLQSFSDTSVAITTQQDISKTIHSVLRLLKSMTREVRVFVDVKKFFVQVNHGLLQQTLYNLVKNSCEALAMKGTVKIYSTETVEHYQLIIEDDGPGLPEIVKANLFSPFMSTRESQGGTGLGLYIAYESCKKMNIDFQFDDGFKNGTRFQLVFKK
jgi:hypothetical protein